uniref:non-specific serine/threonine protein kinase n=1 Tax=Candidozyma auris TaxID=498019 RepID=A0A0L0NQU5_CANAR
MTLDLLPLLDPQPEVPKRHNTDLSLDGFPINDKLRFVRKIGAGTYGLIYLVEDVETGAEFAAKMVMTDPPVKNGGRIDVDENKKLIQRKMYEYFVCSPKNVVELDLDMVAREGVRCPFLKEIALHLRVSSHPNVVTIHKVLNLGRVAVMTLMDYYDEGDLFGNIIDRGLFLRPPPWQDQQKLMKNCMLQLIDVVSYCAAQSVFHCDLKPENVMIRYNRSHRRAPGSPLVDYGELQIALIDFGLAMTSNTICCNACRGLSFYMAPERIVNFNTNHLVKSLVDMRQYPTVENAPKLGAKLFPTLAGDIWLLGVLFINITCARNPWPIANINDVNDVFGTYILQNRDILASILPILHRFNRLLDEIFRLNPNERILLADLYRKIARIDFFSDEIRKDDEDLVYNPQLSTPPPERPLAERDFVPNCPLLIKTT